MLLMLHAAYRLKMKYSHTLGLTNAFSWHSAWYDKNAKQACIYKITVHLKGLL